jgi:hypothetical protein
MPESEPGRTAVKWSATLYFRRAWASPSSIIRASHPRNKPPEIIIAATIIISYFSLAIERRREIGVPKLKPKT